MDGQVDSMMLLRVYSAACIIQQWIDSKTVGWACNEEAKSGNVDGPILLVATCNLDITIEHE